MNSMETWLYDLLFGRGTKDQVFIIVSKRHWQGKLVKLEWRYVVVGGVRNILILLLYTPTFKVMGLRWNKNDVHEDLEVKIDAIKDVRL